MSSVKSVPPPLPISRSTQAAPSQVDFLLSQVRSTLRYLTEIGGFEESTYRQIHTLLLEGARPLPLAAGTVTRSEEPQQEEELGKRNAWLRKVLGESSLLPTTVETALSLTAGPLLNDDQKDAIVQLVELSQKGVAKKVTDPRLQRQVGKTTWSGAVAAHTGTSKAVKGIQRSLDEKEKQRIEKAQRKEEKKRRKEEEKQIKEELKREREQVIRQRQQQILAGTTSTSVGEATAVSPEATSRGAYTTSPTSTLDVRRREQSIPSLTATSTSLDDNDGSSSSDDDDEFYEPSGTFTTAGPVNVDHIQEGDAIGETATLSVLSDHRLGSPESQDRGVTRLSGTNTAFVIEPGLAINCSIVVLRGPKDTKFVAEDGRYFDEERSLRTRQSTSESLRGSTGRILPPPPPPPVHPDAGRSSSTSSESGRRPSTTASVPPQGLVSSPSSASDGARAASTFAPPNYPPPSDALSTPPVPPRMYRDPSRS